MSLAPQQVHLFRHKGFLKLKDRLPGEQVEELKKAIWRNVREEVQPVVRDREGRVVRISGVVDREPVFFETASSPLVLDPLESLLGPNIELIKNRHNHATLRLASENRPEGLHRDVSGRLYDEARTRHLLDQALPVPMPEGGMLVIDSMIMHGVGQNQTDGTRMSMTMGYHSVDELSDVENPQRILVRGERPYDGNDTRN